MKLVSRRLGLLFFELLFSISAMGYCPKTSPSSGNPVEEIPVYHLVPTQYAYGAKTADTIRARFENGEGGFVKSFRTRFATKPIPGIKGPSENGGIATYITDNHHMIIPVQQAYSMKRLSDVADANGDRETLVCVAIEVDATHMSWNEFIFNLYGGTFGSRLGYFRHDIREYLDDLRRTVEPVSPSAQESNSKEPRELNFQKALSDAYGDLFLKRLDQLDDLPLRSAVADLSQSLGLRGRFFKEYIEFMLAERIQRHSPGLGRPNASLSSLSVFKELFGHQKTISFWKNQIKPGLDPQNREQILKIFLEAQSFYIEKLINSDETETEQLKLLEHYFNARTYE